MIDIHCHILPQFDDGATDIYEALQMAQTAANSGVHTIVATPHCNIEGNYHNYYSEHYNDVFNRTAAAIKKENIPVTLLKGMEVYVTFDLPKLIADGKILTLNNSRYILTEFDFCEDPEFVEFMVDKIIGLDLVPVIAHPERYEFFRYNPSLLETIKNSGCLFQCNKDSFFGLYGKTAQRIVLDMIEKNLIDILASDAHRMEIRTTDMSKIQSILDDKTADTLLRINPQKICNNQTI